MECARLSQRYLDDRFLREICHLSMTCATTLPRWKSMKWMGRSSACVYIAKERHELFPRNIQFCPQGIVLWGSRCSFQVIWGVTRFFWSAHLARWHRVLVLAAMAPGAGRVVPRQRSQYRAGNCLINWWPRVLQCVCIAKDCLLKKLPQPTRMRSKLSTSCIMQAWQN